MLERIDLGSLSAFFALLEDAGGAAARLTAGPGAIAEIVGRGYRGARGLAVTSSPLEASYRFDISVEPVGA